MILLWATNNRKSKKSKRVQKNAHVLDELELELNGYDKNLDDKNIEMGLSKTKKELFMLLDVEGPQLNFQNELSNSQLLLVGKGTMRVSLYNYIFRDPKNPRKKYSVKKQIKFFLSQMDAYVAPTIINIVSPTFWLYEHETKDNSEEIPEMENLLRKIMETEKAGFNFDINNKDFCNHTKPLLSIEIKISNTKATFTPQNWWHFIFVIQSMLFASGDKSTEKIFLDKLRSEELQTYKIDTLNNLIQKKLQSMINQQEIANKPMIDKKVMWEISNGYLELFDDHKMFSSVDMSNLTGSFLMYSSKETKCDIDIYKIIIQNYFDHSDYKWVLFPGFSELNPKPIDYMVKIRIRDKFIFVKDAPWKVFDQFEIFLNSMTVKLTKKFYEKINKFMLFKEEQKKRDELQSMQDEKKISILMPSRGTTYADHNYDDLEPIFDVNNKGGSANSSDSDDSDDENSEPSLETHNFETKTKNYKKYQAKAVQSKGKKNVSSFSLNNISKRISSTFKTMRSVKRNKNTDDSVVRHPVYFRYFRINEIGVSLTYKHSESSMLNTKNLRIIIKPFIKHSKFVTFQKMLNKYEKFCKKSLVYQIPSILKQKLLRITLSKDDDDDDFKDDQYGDQRLIKAKQILFGKYSYNA